jgi:hypothetical protein
MKTFNLEDLALPFPAAEVEFRVGSTTRDKAKGQALPYITARGVAARLDDVVGPENWTHAFSVGPAAGSVICRLGIRCGADGAFIYKEDGSSAIASSTDGSERGNDKAEMEIKGAYSDAFKRAAVHWGVGRYLYAHEALWVELKDGKYFKETPKLPASLTPTLVDLVPVRKALREIEALLSEGSVDAEVIAETAIALTSGVRAIPGAAELLKTVTASAVRVKAEGKPLRTLALAVQAGGAAKMTAASPPASPSRALPPAQPPAAPTRDPAKLDKAVEESLKAIQTWDVAKCERQKPLVPKHFGEGTPQAQKVLTALQDRITELQKIGYTS